MIKRIRDILGWSQADMAKFFGTTQSNISHWESGRHDVPAVVATVTRRLEAVADASAEPTSLGRQLLSAVDSGGMDAAFLLLFRKRVRDEAA
jgi:transcriptional regulator with XRE-family HTH domain